ncbi:MAG: hypothetical protein ACT4QD_15190 [Acidobacteriota bacterium]
MRETHVRSAGLALTCAYAAVLVWLFATQPRTVTEAVGTLSANVGSYSADALAFADGLAFFRKDQFVEARAALARADPASRDARTQFYIAYSFYREGWHRTHHDDALFAKGLAHINRAIAVAPSNRLVVDDENLQMKSADEVKAELEAGLTGDASDLNPLRLFRSRK